MLHDSREVEPLAPLRCDMPCRHHDGITSAILVGAQVVRHASPASQEVLWEGFVAAAWPWTMWHHHAIRSDRCSVCQPGTATCLTCSSCHGTGRLTVMNKTYKLSEALTLLYRL